MRVAVIGGGYVGLMSAAGLASMGHQVSLGEINVDKIAQLRSGRLPIFEPGLSELVNQSRAANRLTFHTNNIEAVRGADIIILALPTPPADDGTVDTWAVESVVREIAPTLAPGAIIATKSTVPVGTAKLLANLLMKEGSNASVVSNPEFIREGRAVRDFFSPDRIVIGANDPTAADRVADMYGGIDSFVLKTTPECAEMVKYAANAYLATRVVFANSIANVCEAVGADVIDVLEGAGMDRRIGTHFMRPGPGFGGSCFPKDSQALVSLAEEAGYRFSLLDAVVKENEAQMKRTIDKVARSVDGLANPMIAMWGLTFKAGTDDLRESPAIRIAEGLIGLGMTVRAYDPTVSSSPIDGLTLGSSPLDAANNSDALVIATEWPEFASVSMDELRSAMQSPTIIDARNLLYNRLDELHGFTYVGIGR